MEKVTKRKVQDWLKRGKGSQKQAIVALEWESTPLEDSLSGKERRDWYFFKLKMLGDVSRESVEGFVKEPLDPKSVLFTDKSTAYVNLEKMVDNHIKVKSSYESANGDLNWEHIAISNLKKNLSRIYHMISEMQIQSYLNKFTYKLNGRYFGDKLFY